LADQPAGAVPHSSIPPPAKQHLRWRLCRGSGGSHGGPQPQGLPRRESRFYLQSAQGVLLSWTQHIDHVWQRQIGTNYASGAQEYFVGPISQAKNDWLRVQCTAFCIHPGALPWCALRQASWLVDHRVGQKREATWLLRSIAAASDD